MKIAYLVIAHDQPKLLQRSINALNSENVYFFVHVDLKSNISEFNCFDRAKNVFFLEKRVSVNHGGFSLTQVMTNLLQAAFSSSDFDYFIFLSGRDYPIKSNDYICDFLTDYYPMNFIDFYHLTDEDRFAGNIKKYNFVDLIGYSPKSLKVPLKAIRFILYRLLPDRVFVNHMIPFRGSQWFCLNQETTKYIINFLLNTKDAKEYVNFFKQVWGSDEIFFQTLVLNSPYAKKCLHEEQNIKSVRKYVITESKSAYLHYIDWSKHREDPAVFDINDFEVLRKCHALFARKFCEKKSEQLLDSIDRFLLRPQY